MVDKPKRLIDRPEYVQMLSEQFGEQQFQGDQPVCGRELNNGRGRCTRSPGWGAIHLGYGPCVDHGGERTTDLDVRTNGNTYHLVVQNERFKDLIEEEYRNSSAMDNVDGEIILLRAMIKLLAEKFGLQLAINSDGSAEEEQTIAYQVIGSQGKQIVNLIRELSKTIKQKYEVMQMAGDMISKETVYAYMREAQIVLQNTLRNTCKDCGAEHNMRDNAVTALGILGNI